MNTKVGNQTAESGAVNVTRTRADRALAKAGTPYPERQQPVAVSFLASLLVFFLAFAASAAEVANLRCEHLSDPLGIDVAAPRLSWIITSERRGEVQTAYEVLVASSPELLERGEGDLWKSGKVASAQSVLVPYAGKPLPSLQRCHWKVRVWDREGRPTEWSQPAIWSMGLLSPEDWQAKWITAAPAESLSLTGRSWMWGPVAGNGGALKAPAGGACWFRRSFSLPQGARVSGATLGLTADNSFAAFINGQRVLAGDRWETQYITDVKPHLAAGENVIAITATNAGSAPNAAGLIGILSITLEGGEKIEVPVDATWRVSDRESPGWNQVKFDDAAWSQAVEVVRFGAEPWGSTTKPEIRPPLLRASFRAEKPVQRAELAITGLGFFEARLNGAPLGDAVLEPDWTDYRKTCGYRIHDVTSRIVQGENVLGVLLGNGMYRVTGGRYVKFTGSFGPPKLIAQLRITYEDGTVEHVLSDANWRAADSPIVFTCIYGGEDYDARRELPGWDRPGFDASAWQPARECDGPGGRLTTQGAPPNKIMQEFKTVRVTQPKPGVWVYDLGQNFSGWPCLKVEGKAGATVRLVPGELLHANGTVSQASSGGPMWFSYTLKGGEMETWHPRFSYYGFRYVQVEGAAPADATDAPADLPRIRSLTGQFIYAAAAPTGDIASSDPDLGRIHRLITAAIRSNFKSVLTDCPHREKLGWLEVSHLLAHGVMYNFEAPTFYAKICRDMRDAQLANGMVPDIAPEYVVFSDGFRDSPEWGSASVINPWLVWQMYGDMRPLEEHYEVMKRYVAYLGGKAKDHLVSHGLGDWYDVGPGGPGVSKLTSPGLTATATYLQDINILRQAAALLKRPEDVRTYTELAARVQAAFNARFLRADAGQYDKGSQTANAMPLALGLVDEPLRSRVLENLIKEVTGRGYHVTAGDVGFSYLVRALTDAERGDVLYGMAKQTDGPGYLYQLKKDATALTEAWDANPGSSQNHCMLGHIEEWFFRGLGGIRSDPSGPGFEKIIIRPQPVEGLTWATATYDSIRGRIVTAWKREDNRLTLFVTLPANTTATVFMPAPDAAAVTEGNRPAADAEGVRFLRAEPGAAVYAVGSGTYSFSSAPPRK